MLIFTGEHYGEKVEIYDCSKHQFESLKWYLGKLKDKNISYKILPILNLDNDYTVIYYKKDDGKIDQFCIFKENSLWYYLIEKLPVDLDIDFLVKDIKNQYWNCKPTQMPEKFKKLFDKVFEQSKKSCVPKNSTRTFIEREKWILSLLEMREKEREKDSKKQLENDEWNYLIQEKVQSFYQKIVAAELLKKEKIDYFDMEKIAKESSCNDFKSELEWLEDGYFWYDDFKEYLAEHKNERELLINVWDYGWLEPDGTFHPVSWNHHAEWAVAYVNERKLIDYHGSIKYGMKKLLEDGWVLLDNPKRFEPANVYNKKPLTQEQKLFLADYFLARKQIVKE